MFITQLDSPTNLGNQDATSAIVIEDAGTIRHAATRLVGICCTGSDEEFNQAELSSAVTSVANSLRTLFTDVKGASRLVDDLPIRQKFLESARQLGSFTAQLLDSIGSQGGQSQDEEEKQVMLLVLSTSFSSS
jgi:hypothetical protein